MKGWIGRAGVFLRNLIKNGILDMVLFKNFENGKNPFKEIRS